MLHTAALLVGGHSRRFGFPKALLPFLKGRLIDHAYSIAQQIAATVIVIGSPALRSFCPATAYSEDVFPQQGPLSGILTALRRCSSEWIAILPVDLPFLSPELYHFLWQYVDAPGVLYATTSQHQHVLVSLWHRNLESCLTKLLRSGIRRVHAALHQLPHQSVDCSHFERRWFPSPFYNLNTPAEYRALRQLLQQFSLWNTMGGTFSPPTQ